MSNDAKLQRLDRIARALSVSTDSLLQGADSGGPRTDEQSERAAQALGMSPAALRHCLDPRVDKSMAPTSAVGADLLRHFEAIDEPRRRSFILRLARRWSMRA